MPGLKRLRVQDDVADEEINDVHPSRKRRMPEFSRTDTKLAKIYGELAEHDSQLRLQAAIALLETIKSQSSEEDELIARVLQRLIKGLCSSNKAARLGFSVALSEVVRLALDRAAAGDAAHSVDLASLTAQCIDLTQPDSKANAQQTRDCLLGRRFAFQSILQSDAGLRKDVTEAQWATFLSAMMTLAVEKDWLRSECGAMLYEYLNSEGRKLGTARVQGLVDALQEAKLLKTAEGVALWLIIAEHWTETLPKGVWSKKDPFVPEEQAALKQAMITGAVLEGDATAMAKRSGSGTRQSRPTPAWHHVLDHLYRRGAQSNFTRFWREVVVTGFFSNTLSDERKALGLQLVSLSVTDAPEAYLSSVLDGTILRIIIAHRVDNTRYLYEAAKQVLDTIAKRSRSQPTASSIFLQQLVRNGAFDQQTRTKTIDTLVQQADFDGLDGLVTLLRDSIFDASVKERSSLDSRQRTCADLLLNMIRGRRGAEQQSATTEDSANDDSEVVAWLEHALQIFVEAGYSDSSSISESMRSTFRSRLTSSLASLLVLPSEKLSTIFSAVLTALAASQKSKDAPLDKPSQLALKAAGKARKKMSKIRATQNVKAAASSAFDILFGLSMLQVYNGEADSVEALNDLQASYEVWQGGEEASTGLIELLLSFLSKPSKLLRKLSEQVFTVFAKDVTAEGLHSLVDILQQKESLSGQQELFKQDGDEDGDRGEDMSGLEDDAEAMDVEDMSDVELVNGEVLVNDVRDDYIANGLTGSVSDEADESDESSDSASDTTDDAEPSGEDEDEESEFDRKLALALGSAAANGSDSGSDDGDLDDDQMMAFEEPLTNVFREQRKLEAQRQDNKGAKENMINFKNRVLDLLSIYVRSQYGNVLTLDLILPLTMLVRTSSGKDTREKAHSVLTQFFDACSKHKCLPQPEDMDAVFGVLEAVHEEMKMGSGSKAQSAACSRSSLFLAKVAVGMDLEGAAARVGEVYQRLWTEWYCDGRSGVQGKVFRDWLDWAENTRRSRLEARGKR